MKKIIVLFFILFLVSGCDAVYKLEYVDNVMKESLTLNNLSGYEEQVRSVYTFDLSTNYEDISDYTKEDGLVHGYTYYEKSLNENNGLSLNYSYDFSLDLYDHSYIGRTIYPNLNFNEDTLYSGKISDIYVKYPALNNIVIEFNTDKYVSYNNADSVVGNTYYWYLSKDNYKSKKIELIFLKEKNNNIFQKLEENPDIEIQDSKGLLKLILIVLGLILSVVFIFVFIKFKNSNKK